MFPQISRIWSPSANRGRAILAVREAGFRVDSKDDASPVTAADLAANEILVAGLVACSTLPILSEEGREVPWVERREWRRFWLIDPLDGTREFVDGFDDFTVNVALIEEGRPVLGVVHAPASGVSWAGVAGEGAWRCQQGESLVNGHFIACAALAWRDRLAAVSRQAVWGERKPRVE
ncbi:3'(2'),5'-bisphosphate nucleotidase CysQ family protein [Halomonas sp. HK25]|uniref:3'(2'),5'-bisphosphate nucleotidase CysQ family protein n=1 Tax=Halomonas sp. HK25 TaxID=3394321 RepID=UPI0039FDA0C1